jgi:hypothetical protein
MRGARDASLTGSFVGWRSLALTVEHLPQET